VLTGVISLFIGVARAATLHVNGITIPAASDAAGALKPLAGHLGATLFGLGFLGAALLAACIVPLSTAHSVAEAFRRPCDLNDSFAEPRLFYLAYGGGGARRCGRADPGCAAGLDPLSHRRSTPSCCC
jgi:Mn2+/Fe2+ NRAMP family transporter